MLRFRRLLAYAVLLLAATPATAAWFEATTPHFIIRADSTEAKVRDFAERLERLDRALRYGYGRKDDPSRSSNRVIVYAVSPATILKLCHGCGPNIAGFYMARAGGSVIFTSALAGREGVGMIRNLDLDPQEVLFHEYSHHFMYSNYPNVAFPQWFAEGFADFNANMLVQPNGDVYLGMVANYRAYGLRAGPTLSIETLLAPQPKDLADPMRFEVFYGRAWLLMHFLMLDRTKKKALDDYLSRIVKGEDSLTAGRHAFGDLKQLDRELKLYMNRKLNPPWIVPAASTAPNVTVRQLSPGGAAMMPIHLRSAAGVDARSAARIVVEAEAKAAPYPQDIDAQTMLAEAEFDAGRLNEAEAACDRALAIDDKIVRLLIYKGRIAIRRLVDAKSADTAAWQQARRWLVRANRADTEAAGPLIAYYESYLAQGIAPPPLAVDGLVKSAQLAGEDESVVWLLARQRLADGKPEATRTLLSAIAMTPHETALTARAREIVALIDAGKTADAKAAFDRPDADDSQTPPPKPGK